MFSQVSYCKHDKEQSKASKEQYENAENKTNHMKTLRRVFKRGKPDHSGEKTSPPTKPISPSILESFKL